MKKFSNYNQMRAAAQEEILHYIREGRNMTIVKHHISLKFGFGGRFVDKIAEQYEEFLQAKEAEEAKQNGSGQEN